jgi:hypothetical protein
MNKGIPSAILLLAFSFISCKDSSKQEKKTTDQNEKKESKDSTTTTTTGEQTSGTIDTIAALSDFSEEAIETYFKPFDGNTYKVTLVEPSAEEAALADAEDADLDCTTDNIHARDRRINKMTLVNKRTEAPYTTLRQFIQTLQGDDEMRSINTLTRDPENPRVNQERRNVRLTNLYLFAIKREKDNDFHLIIGDNNGLYFNAECSGLPAADYPSYATLRKVRRQIEGFFRSEFCSNKYTVFEPGIRLYDLSGSLFYDIDHAPGIVGPADYKPRSAWEIHPISNIDFGNNR